MAILTPDQRHALTGTDTTIAATAEMLATRWVAATVPAEITVTVEASEPDELPTRAKKTIYRCAQALPVTLAGLSPEQTTTAITAAAALLTSAGWTVSILPPSRVVTVTGAPTA
jgi:hypothetical protein